MPRRLTEAVSRLEECQGLRLASAIVFSVLRYRAQLDCLIGFRYPYGNIKSY